jgi:RNAse (barnase) inhibitor barstar
MGEIVHIDADKIVDSESFHSVFAETLGFINGYGRNMDAWIDCMSYVDDPKAGMTSIHVEPGSVLTLVVHNAKSFKARCPNEFADLVECSAFVNWRVMERSGNFAGSPLLALAFFA